MTAPTGVLLMAYGTPSSPEDIERYYTDIRRGRPPTPEALAELTARYAAIGGISPLAARTEAQRAALQRALDEEGDGEYTVVLGQKHAFPFVEDGAAQLAAVGVEHAVGLVLAPHYSAFSIGQYQERASKAGAIHGMTVSPIESWHLEPAYLDFLADGVRSQLAALGAGTKVLFTAHSLPERILASGDPYPDQLRATAVAVAARVGLQPWSGWGVAWQSAGRTPEPWIGPDILQVVHAAGAAETRALLVCAAGFVADHLEVLFDLDIEAKGVADGVGVAFARTPCVNDDATVMQALARRVVAAAALSDAAA